MLPKNKANLKAKIFLVLHNIRSAYNVGSIFRTADGAGVDKIFLCGYTPIPTTMGIIAKGAMMPIVRKIAKTALGAEKTVSWEHWSQTWRLLEKLKKDGVEIIALEQADNAVDYRKFKPKFLPVGRQVRLALIVGNEVNGLSKKILEYCDKIIEIPMRGKKESLNVSVAVGVALYEITKQNS
ncbi:MAG: RNA methyltransferase [Candidatus Yanofskybacteria bacterium]|nr:RNA methyltransferase [Candidatus Yanofskybacteria bacterium]